MRNNVKLGKVTHRKEKRHGRAYAWCGVRYWTKGFNSPRATYTTQDVDCMACIAERPTWIRA
jgi:hypothetical protein